VNVKTGLNFHDKDKFTVFVSFTSCTIFTWEKKSLICGPLNYTCTQYSPHSEDRIIPFFTVFVSIASECFRNINFCSILEKVRLLITLLIKSEQKP